MSKVIEDGLKHFRAKAARYRSLAEKAEAEVARLEALLQKRQPTTLAVDTARPPLTEEALQILKQCFPYVREN
jgi:hypothetical protein